MLVISGIHLKFQEVYSRPEKMHSPTEVETFCWDSFLERDKIIYYVCEFSGGVVKNRFLVHPQKKKIHFPPPKKGLEKPSQKHRIPPLRPPVPPPPPEAPPVPPTPPSDLPALPEIPPLTPEAGRTWWKGGGGFRFSSRPYEGKPPFSRSFTAYYISSPLFFFQNHPCK